TIAQASNTQAPLTLRFNPLRHNITSALTALENAGLDASQGAVSPQAIYLHDAINVERIPGFTEGDFSVQDEAAQLPVQLLEAPANGRLLDACAAPGGKTGQIAELFPQVALTAIDSESNRLPRIQENLTRLNAQATILCADASTPSAWHQGPIYDGLLLDAPCSATGTLRRQTAVI